MVWGVDSCGRKEPYVSDGMLIDATWRIQSNDPCARWCGLVSNYFDQLFCTGVGSTARGELAAKTTYQRAAKGAIAVSECPPDGKCVKLENTGRRVITTAPPSVFSCLRTLTTWHCPHLPSARAPAAAIDRHRLPAGPTAASLLQTDRRTEGQTDGHRTVL